MPKSKKGISANKKVCVLCGKEILHPYGKQKYCLKCREKKRSEYQRERYKKRTENIKSIDDINAKARSLGMSYGKYMAYIHRDGSQSL